jgi:gluconolactonase
MSNQSMGATKPGAPQLIASGLGWPEGPTVMPDHSLVFVDTYRSQLTTIGLDSVPRHFAYAAGGPNSCVLGSDGALYVCQNGGTTGPWRAKEMVEPSIQRVHAGGKAETLITHVEGIKLNGPNDLAFAPDGSLVFSDPGTYNLRNPDPS